MTLEVQNLGVTYPGKAAKRVVALADVNLTVENDEFVTLIGPSGCGKSTLLHTLGGLLEPTTGRVLFDGKPIVGPDPWDAAFVFQEYSLLPWMNILDNVAIGLRFAGQSKNERRAKAMSMLELVGLHSVAKSYPHELSGGMQQRVAVARGLVMTPKVLLMDEPFGALDEQTRRSLGYEMSRMLTESGKGVVMVTHSLDEAIFWADRIVVMSPRPGRIVRELRVDQPRPRDVSFIATPEFAEIRQQLFELVVDAHSPSSQSELAEHPEEGALL